MYKEFGQEVIKESDESILILMLSEEKDIARSDSGEKGRRNMEEGPEID